MKLTSEIISSNLERLEKSKKDFPILTQYENCNDFHMKMNLREEANQFNLGTYIEFIDFIKDTKRKNQEVFYRKKITSNQFQETLMRYAYDEDAKKSFSTKSKKSFEVLINSEKWEKFSGNQPNRNRGYRPDNFDGSAAIIANFVIQNGIDVSSENLYRISKWYTVRLPEPERSILVEMEQTKELIDRIIETISKCEIDFKKLNFTHLTDKLQEEIKKHMLKIEKGEKIRCVDPSNLENITYSSMYGVIDKKLTSGIIGGGVLSVLIKNDNGEEMWYPYRHFETATNMRDSFLDELINS
jgi:hypothetical protein